MPKKKRTDQDNPSAIKSWRFEIVNADHETRQVWHRLTDSCRTVANRWWQLWESRHVAQGNVERLATFVEGHAAWKRSQALQGEYATCLKRYKSLIKRRRISDARQAFRNYFAQARLPLVDVEKPPPAPNAVKRPPKCDVPIMPDEKGGSIYTALSNSSLGKTMHTRTIVLLLQRIQMRLTGKDADGVWHLWQAVLLGRQGRPSAERDQPIPFDKETCTAPKLVSETKARAVFECRVRLARQAVKGKDRCESVEQTVRFIAEKAGLAIAQRIESGEYAMRGSQLFFSKRHGKWFVSFTYRMPGVAHESVGTGVAFLRPAATHPWSFWRIGKRRPWRIAGRGHYVAAMRSRLVTRRGRESESYQWAGHARRGHGRNRALGPVAVLQNAWRNFVTGTNRILVSRVVEECKRTGVGKLVYFQPTDKRREQRFLSTAGKVEGQRESTLWDWYQVGSLLAQKCQDAGIELVVRKGRERSGGRAAA